MLLGRVRITWRRLWSDAGFSASVIVSLALGFGGLLTAYAFVDGILLRRLPYAAPERLVAVRHATPGRAGTRGDHSEATYFFYREHNEVFDDVGAYVENVVALSDRGEPEQIHVALVTPSVFRVLGVTAVYGRLFTQEEDVRSKVPVVLLGHELWTRRYGADPAIVGQTIELNRRSLQVVGVLPAGFYFPNPEVQVWYTLGLNSASPDARGWYLSVIARLRDGISPDRATSNLLQLAGPLVERFPDLVPVSKSGRMQPQVLPLRDAIVGRAKAPLWILFGATVSVLLLVWANVSNLFLVRAEKRKREVAVKQALGVSRTALLTEYLIEAMCLAIPASVLALLGARAAVAGRLGMEPSQLPLLEQVSISGTTLTVAVGVVVCTCALCGFVSFWRAQGGDLLLILRGGVQRYTDGRDAFQRLLVAVQMALALVLLIGAAAMMQSFAHLHRVQLGFDPTGVWTGALSLPYKPYATFVDSALFYKQLEERLRSTPGVQGAGSVSALPLASKISGLMVPIEREGLVDDARHRMAARVLATPNYFATMQIPLVAGRTFQTGDADSQLHPVIVSAGLAATLFPDGQGLGKRLRTADGDAQPWCSIVGIVGDVPGERLEERGAFLVYYPVVEPLQAANVPLFPSDMTLVVRSNLPKAAMAATVRRILRELDPKLPVARSQMMSEVVAESNAYVRLTALLLVSAAAAALFLGGLGIYSVISSSVNQRLREIGLRLALGAESQDVIRLLIRETATPVLAGVLVGIAAASFLSRFLESLVFEVNPGNPAAIGALAIILCGIALLAAYIPARRAGRVDPMRSLNAE